MKKRGKHAKRKSAKVPVLRKHIRPREIRGKGVRPVLPDTRNRKITEKEKPAKKAKLYVRVSKLNQPETCVRCGRVFYKGYLIEMELVCSVCHTGVNEEKVRKALLDMDSIPERDIDDIDW